MSFKAADLKTEVAGKSYLFTGLERESAIAVELHFIEPIPDRQLWDSAQANQIVA